MSPKIKNHLYFFGNCYVVSIGVIGYLSVALSSHYAILKLLTPLVYFFPLAITLGIVTMSIQLVAGLVLLVKRSKSKKTLGKKHLLSAGISFLIGILWVIGMANGLLIAV